MGMFSGQTGLAQLLGENSLLLERHSLFTSRMSLFNSKLLTIQSEVKQLPLVISNLVHFGIILLITQYLLGRKLEDEVIAQRVITYIKGPGRTTTTT